MKDRGSCWTPVTLCCSAMMLANPTLADTHTDRTRRSPPAGRATMAVQLQPQPGSLCLSAQHTGVCDPSTACEAGALPGALGLGCA